MNKIQLIELLKLRGITELKGNSIASAIIDSGGDPSEKELVKVNQKSMEYYIGKRNEEVIKCSALQKRVDELQKIEYFMSCLEAAGVDNWEGYSIAIGMRDENHKN